MIEKEKAISLINDKIIVLLKNKTILDQELELLSQNPNTDPVTINKINQEVLDINLMLEALQNEALTIS
jgi:choline kinase